MLLYSHFVEIKAFSLNFVHILNFFVIFVKKYAYFGL